MEKSESEKEIFMRQRMSWNPSTVISRKYDFRVTVLFFVKDQPAGEIEKS